MSEPGSAWWALAALVAWLSACASTPNPPPAPAGPRLASPPPAPEAPCSSDGWAEEAERLEASFPEQAKRLLRECLAVRHGSPSAWRLLASLETDAGELLAARKTLLRAVASHPDDPFAWAALARLDDDAGRGELALGAFERAHRLRPDDEGLASERARALARYGSGRERLGARLAPLFAEADGRAELGDVEGAMSTLDTGLLVAEGKPALEARVELRRSLISLAAGSIEASLSAARRGLGLLGEGEDEPALRAELWIVEAEARLRRGEPRAAALAARSAQAHVPAHPLASANLALALIRLGDGAAATEALLAALDHGLARRLEMSAFLDLDGVRDLVGTQARLSRAVERAWRPSQPEARSE